MVIDNNLINGETRRRKIREANELKKAQVLLEIFYKMDKIQVEKFPKYKDGWRDCDLIELKAKLIHTINSMVLVKSTERHLRDILHAFNYLFFLYNRIKNGER